MFKQVLTTLPSLVKQNSAANNLEYFPCNVLTLWMNSLSLFWRNVLKASHYLGRNLIYFLKVKNKTLARLVNNVLKSNYLAVQGKEQHIITKVLYSTCPWFYCNLHYRKFCGGNLGNIGLHILYLKIRPVQPLKTLSCTNFEQKTWFLSAEYSVYGHDAKSCMDLYACKVHCKNQTFLTAHPARQMLLETRRPREKFTLGHTGLYLFQEIYQMFTGRQHTWTHEMAHK